MKRNPEVTAIDGKIRETRTRLGKEEKEIKSTTASYNPSPSSTHREGE